MKKLGKDLIVLSKNRSDIIKCDNIDYGVESINGDGRTISGGNGCVFKCISSETGLEYALKISKVSHEDAEGNDYNAKRISRFMREIEALDAAKQHELADVVDFIGWGNVEIEGQRHPFFIMELCDCHLGDIVNARKDLYDLDQKIELAVIVVRGIQSLNRIKIYHRDIKYENILFKNDRPLIADLGLAYKRDSDIIINEFGEKIGPIGWMSPESINKWFTEDSPYAGTFDCEINTKSDVFQLGKLIWYIVQGNLPIGLVELDDFQSGDSELFNIIKDALVHNKAKRIGIDELTSRLEAKLA